MTYDDMLSTLYARAAGTFKLGLEGITALLSELGDPQESCPKVLVAGTNGKGSTASLIAQALQGAGHKVGLFTSPHLLRFTERIRVNGRELSNERAVALFEEVHAAEQRLDRQVSFFEATCAMAWLHFRASETQIAVMEVGLGGRLDATNVGPTQLAVVTPIGLDHQQYLGGTLAEIAQEKAGIFGQAKAGVTAPQEDEVLEVLAAESDRLGMALYPAPKTMQGQEALCYYRGPLLSPLPLATPEWTPFQRENSAVAVGALTLLDQAGIKVTPAQMEEGFVAAGTGGRYEWVGDDNSTLLDCAHNALGLEALFASLAEDERAEGRPLHVCFTILTDRDLESILPPLREHAASLHGCPVNGPRSREQSFFAELEGVDDHPELAQAIEAAKARAAKDNGVVVITGSLMLAGEALALLRNERRDPPVAG